ncbi:MAG: YqaA family protein [Schleiferiaceae bacterium]
MPKRIPQFLKAYHLLLVRTGGYTFLRSNLLKLGASILIILGLFYLIDGYIINIDDAMAWVTQILSPAGLISVFLFSEVSFGFITPELLIVWADETLKPNWMLALLATLSYTAGIVSYFIGRFWSTRKIVRERILERNATTMDQLRRFGGLLIILAALTPLPYPIVCQLSGMNKYPFKYFVWITLVRFLRFGLYGALLFSAF